MCVGQLARAGEEGQEPARRLSVNFFPSSPCATVGWFGVEKTPKPHHVPCTQISCRGSRSVLAAVLLQSNVHISHRLECVAAARGIAPGLRPRRRRTTTAVAGSSARQARSGEVLAVPETSSRLLLASRREPRRSGARIALGGGRTDFHQDEQQLGAKAKGRSTESCCLRSTHSLRG